MKYAWHVFKYILVFVINLLILLFVHSYFNFIVMILMIVLPVVSIVCAFVLSRHLTVKFGGGGAEPYGGLAISRIGCARQQQHYSEYEHRDRDKHGE